MKIILNNIINKFGEISETSLVGDFTIKMTNKDLILLNDFEHEYIEFIKINLLNFQQDNGFEDVAVEKENLYKCYVKIKRFIEDVYSQNKVLKITIDEIMNEIENGVVIYRIITFQWLI